ncbi:MAG: CRTAC1 family protein, partial [Planctomycetota bacterium]
MALGAVVLLAGTSVSSESATPTLTFRDLSAVSGGPVDFGTPYSSVEKASGGFVDVDGDGWDDLITLTGKDLPCGYFLNRPAEGGGREYVPAPPGNGLDEGEPLAQDGASITSGDVDNDGDVDLYIGCAWNHALGHGGNILLLNNGSGEFEDVTDDAGLRDRFSTTAACAFFDMDLDGDLDLVVMNSDFPGADKAGDGKTYLYRNTLAETGELLFVDETEERLDTRANVGAWAVVAPDLDMDGDPDLILTRDIEGLTQFYRNDGTGHFTDESSLMGSGSGDDAVPSTFGNDSRNAMGADVADTNNDGYIDLYISDIGTNALYLGNADGTVTERGRTSRVLGGTVSWGCAFADFDLDGWVDLHVAAGDFYDSYRESIRPFLYQNRGDGKFDEVFDGSGLRHDPPLHREVGSSISDFDGDGRVDVLVVRAERAGASPYLYRNTTDTGDARWITVRLRGDGGRSNVSAVGAKIRVWPRDADGALLPGLAQLREVMASRGRACTFSLAQTFGLGCDAETVDVEVTWPRAGSMKERRDLYVGLPVNTTHLLVDDIARQPRLDVAMEATVLAGSSTTLSIAGLEEFEVPPTIELESAPDWVSLETGEESGPKLTLLPPRVDEDSVVSMGLRAHLPGVPGSGSRQRIT